MERAEFIDTTDKAEDVFQRFSNIERENAEFRIRFSELEKQNEIFMNLFVSSCQLHSTLDEESILLSMQEIVLQMVGAEVFSIWMVNQVTGDFEIIAATDEGDYFRGKFPWIDEMTIRKLAEGQASYYSYDAKKTREVGEPLACIPLIMEERTIGAIIIYKLLVQKNGFTPLDHEILNLLTNQAVTCLVGARLYAKSGGEPLDLDPLKKMEKSAGIDG